MAQHRRATDTGPPRTIALFFLRSRLPFGLLIWNTGIGPRKFVQVRGCRVWLKEGPWIVYLYGTLASWAEDVRPLENEGRRLRRDACWAGGASW